MISKIQDKDFLTEDSVRDLAKSKLGFDLLTEVDAIFGVGQLTTFNKLDDKFKGIPDKPDGWYLPKNPNEVAVILECKSSEKKISKKDFIEELKKNITIAKQKYQKVVGILYNGKAVSIYKNLQKYSDELDLKNITYYLHLFDKNNIDKHLIYTLTKRINDSLHINFGIKNLYHRMIFTACALVAKRYGAILQEGMDYNTFHTSIHSTLSKSLSDSKQQNQKLDLLLNVYSEIKMNSVENQKAIDQFIANISEISNSLNSYYWNGEDVMGIFFNEFNRYKKKSESGQIFTPDHITSFMYRLLACTKHDVILDATCGSGAFLVKAMCNMINEVGGAHNEKEANQIKTTSLYGIEFDREIFALACANMLIHKDGKTNLEQMDTRSDDACKWIREKNITKVLMNPPYERKYGCMKIVKNVLESVKVGTLCAFILPDKKLEKDGGRQLLKKHKLTLIIKMPENLFNVGTTTSIFVFEAGKSQKGQKIIGYYMESDGLETVKNQGRQDINNRWSELEDYWIEAIQTGNEPRFNTKQIIDPEKYLSYQMPEKELEIVEEDFIKILIDYEMYKQGVDLKNFKESLVNKIMYASDISESDNKILIKMDKKQC